jgi:aspartate racemase
VNQLRQPVIGVIGGAGVAAGALLARMLEEKVTRMGAYRDAHHPEVILWQTTSTPSRSLFLEGRGPDFTPDFVRIARQMKSCGADAFCMVCNTAHYSAEAIEREAGLPLIDMIEALFDGIRRTHPGVRKVGVLCSEGSRDRRVFDRYAAGLDLIYADAEAQPWITAGICGVKNQNRFLPADHPERPKELFRRACERMRKQGADAVALCCTDIAVDFDGRDWNEIPVVDSLEALADAILAYWLRNGEFAEGHPLRTAAQAVRDTAGSQEGC